MKLRFTYLDIRAIVNELHPLILNTYIQNIYSPTNNIYILKLSSKHLLLIEPGTRIHLTDNYDNVHTHFNVIARKYLRRSIIKDIVQIGYDRIIKVVTLKYYIYVEFYAGGNIIITDCGNRIVDLWRTVKEHSIEKGEVYVTNKVELNFSVEMMYKGWKNMVALDKIVNDSIRNKLDKELKKIGYKINKDENGIEIENQKITDEKDIIEEKDKELKDGDKKNNFIENEELKDEDQKNNLDIGNNKKFEDIKNNIDVIKNNKIGEIQNKISKNFFIQNDKKLKNKETIKTQDTNKERNNEWKKESIKESNNDEKEFIKEGLKQANDSNILSDSKFLTLDECKNNKILMEVYNNFMSDLLYSFDTVKNIGTLIYVNGKPNSFMPFKLDNIDPLPSLNEALMIYYKKEQKIIKDKSNVVKDKQQKRIKDLEDEILMCDKKVSIMHDNQIIIEQILMAHKSVIEYNLDWKDFEKHKDEQKELKPFIENSDFKNRTVTVKIENIRVILRFMYNFNNNIKFLYDHKKKLKEKMEKTIKNIDKVVRAVGKKDKKNSIVKKEKIERKIYWFEKFHYFIYRNKLILGGKTAQQNDIIVKKYLELNDLYFHADINGASSIVLKNGNNCDDDNLLEITGLMALCNSNCWKSKVVADVYYVKADQVSKTTESGEYLSTGAFIIRGKKNYIDVYKLEYGIGLVFKKLISNKFELKLNDEFDFGCFVDDPKDEEVEHAMVMSGPWCVLKTYKYNEKLMPGNDKKGKVVTEVMKRFMKKAKECKNQSEVNAIKNLTHDEYVSVMINNSKIGKK